MRIYVFCFALLSLANAASGAVDSTVVQVDFSELLNSDVIVNRRRGGTDITQSPIDSPAFAQTNFSLLTQSAAEAFLPASPDGLPDDGFFPANSFHPNVQLNYRNGDSGNNARRLSRPGQFFVPVPSGAYDDIHLFATSGQGASEFQVLLTYLDGTVSAGPFEVPDWFSDPRPEPSRYFLVNGLDRAKSNASSFQDVNSTAIFGFHLPLDRSRVLNGLTVNVTSVPAGNFSGIPFRGAISFFGVTAIAAVVPEPTTGMLALLSGALLTGNRYRWSKKQV